MKLDTDKKRMIFEFQSLDQITFFGSCSNNHSFFIKEFSVFTIEFVAMAVSFRTRKQVVGFGKFGAGPGLKIPGPKTHRTPKIFGFDFGFLVSHHINNWILSLRINLRGMGIGKTQNISGKFNCRKLHTKAKTEVWYLIFS